MTTTKNPHAVDNVNVKQGPRTGNDGTVAKRKEFKAAKAERNSLADSIEHAYAKRGNDNKETIKSGVEPISDTTKVHLKKK